MEVRGRKEAGSYRGKGKKRGEERGGVRGKREMKRWRNERIFNYRDS